MLIDNHKMIPDIIYPPESYFYPYHVIIAIITSIIFLLISLLYRQYKSKKGSTDINKDKTTTHSMPGGKKKSAEKVEMKSADYISLGALIGTIIFTGLYPFLLSPLLDYTVSLERANIIKIVINNLGVYSAKNVVVSLNAYGANFSHFTSEPALPNSTEITKQKANGIFKMMVLPPRSQTIVRANFQNSSSPVKQLNAYVRSDEKVGYHDTVITSIFYLILGVSYVFFFIRLFYLTNEYTHYKQNILKYLLVILVYEIAFTAAYLYFLAPHHIGIVI